MSKLVSYTKEAYQKYTLKEWLVLAIVASLFASYYITAVLAVILIADFIRKKQLLSLIKHTKGAPFLLVLPIISFCTSFFYASKPSLYISIGLVLVFLTLILFRNIMTKQLFETIIDLCLYLSIAMFLVALFQKLILGLDDPGFRSTSMFYNANYYATVIEMVILFSLYRILNGKHPEKKWFYFAVIFINFIGLEICNCRTSYLVLFLCVPVLMLLMKKKKAFYIYSSIAVAASALLFLFPDLFPRFDEIMPDLLTRMNIWETSVKGILIHPLFGGGNMTYQRIYTAFAGQQATHAHNLILDLLLNYGIVGCLSAFAYFIPNTQAIVKAYQKTDKKRGALAITIVLSVLLHGMFDITVFWPQTGLLVAVILSCVGIYEHPKKYPVQTHTVKIKRRV